MSTAEHQQQISAEMLRHLDDRARRGPLRGVLFSLPWLIFPAVDLLSSDRTWMHKTVTLVAGLLLAAIYAYTILTRHDRASSPWVAIGAMVVLVTFLGLADRDSWAAVGFTLITVVSGLSLPPREGVITVVCLAALTVIVTAISGDARSDVVVQGFTTLGIGGMMLAFSRLIASNRQLAEARMEIARLAVADERLRFARDLHDLLGHSLSVIALKSELASRLIATDPAAAAPHIADVEQVARTSLADVREAVSGYRLPTLAAEIAGARLAFEAAGIDLDVRQETQALPEDVESVLAWAVREATTNAVRHSGAERCELRITADGTTARLEVVDDGCGPQDSAPGSGLTGLAERAARVAGRLEIGAAAGGGFRLALSLPVRTAG